MFELVCSRLRTRFDLRIESNERVWNSVVDASLRGREGFERCLRHTLYRPRDILVLMNATNDVAARQGALRIGEAQLDAAATTISENRLEDLMKEYDRVLPGLRAFVRAFERRPAISTYAEVVAHLDRVIDDGPYEEVGSSDFAIFGTGGRVIGALHGVGFLGFRESSEARRVHVLP